MGELNLSGLGNMMGSRGGKGKNQNDAPKKNIGLVNNKSSNNKQRPPQQNNQRNNNNYNNNNRGFQTNNKYTGAPYNFVSFPDKTIAVDKECMEQHDILTEELLTGEIAYTLTAQTPIFVDNGKGQFVRNARNQIAIPGSTMRGLIRNNVQILGLSGFSQDIDNYNLMYRNVTNGAEKDRYNKVLGAKQVSVQPKAKPIGVLTEVRAGYITKEGKGYVIYQTKVDKITCTLAQMNYYVLSERTVAESCNSKQNPYPFFKKHPYALQHDVTKGFRKEEQGRRVQYKGMINKDYQLNYYPVSYEVKNLKNVAALDEPGKLSANGTLVCTGSMNMKKALYVIPEIDKSKKVLAISDRDEKAFKIDFEKKKNTLKRFKNVEYFNLPKDGEVKPVFYVQLDGRLYFGFTPRLRLFYDHAIMEGYHTQESEFDYARSIFGMTTEKKGYKSKVSFTDAIAYGKIENGERGTYVLGEPKVTSYLDYLKQPAGITTYNTEGFELRGVKQYWLHNHIVKNEGVINNENVGSTITPLVKGTIFKGVIRFQNLTRAELGLLVWSIRLEENSWMNVGKAKAYGFGAVKVSDLSVKTIDLQKAYGLEQFTLDPFVKEEIPELIQAYQTEAAEKYGKRVEALPQIKDFFAMKDSTRIPDEGKIKYMSLGNKDYQSRTTPLQTVQQIAKKKS